jgi:hypothetical protein
VRNSLNPPIPFSPYFIKRGIYVEQIERYLDFFSRDQLMIIESGNFKKFKVENLENIAKFLKIKPFNFEEMILEDTHVSRYNNNRDYDEKTLSNFYKPYNRELFKLLETTFPWS